MNAEVVFVAKGGALKELAIPSENNHFPTAELLNERLNRLPAAALTRWAVDWRAEANGAALTGSVTDHLHVLSRHCAPHRLPEISAALEPVLKHPAFQEGLVAYLEPHLGPNPKLLTSAERRLVDLAFKLLDPAHERAGEVLNSVPVFQQRQRDALDRIACD